MEYFNIILVIEDNRVYCTLIVVVVECLGGILNNESEILRKIGMHQDFTFLQILSHVSYMRRLIFRKKMMEKQSFKFAAKFFDEIMCGKIFFF